MSKRFLLKISGEALKGENAFGVNAQALENLSLVIGKAQALGHQIGIVIGAGNFFRGRDGKNISKTTADNMGMLATVMNSIALSDGLNNCGVETSVYSNVEMNKICKVFNAKDAIRDLEDGKVVIFGGGSGNPFFTTDTAAALKSLEIEADALLLGKNIDGVYDKDPKIYDDAVLFEDLTYNEVLSRDLKVMDQTAITLCKENDVPIFVFDIMNNPENLINVLKGNKIGTIITNEK